MAIVRTYHGKRRKFIKQHFWAREYYVSTVGRDKAIVRQCIQQEAEDRHLEQLRYLKPSALTEVDSSFGSKFLRRNRITLS
ncbi:MAG TPA: hypothetical protein IGS53_26260 [Leptolyngbyaceae cyanobacterium M33_DOE_097]|nr:hypothetical protein [Leptolyngbyaceae cyanobacterium M33_DOE_097]